MSGETPFVEYPKRITTPDGVEVTVVSADEEYQWMHPPTPEAPAEALPALDVAESAPVVSDAPAERPDPLDDIIVEMDNPAFDPPKKKAAKKK